MKKPALRRASKTTLLFVIAAALFLAGLAGTTFGYFDGETDNVATWSGGWVFPPTSAIVFGSPVGGSQTVTWTTPTTTGVQNYVLRGTNMGTTPSPACPAQTVVTTTITTPTATTPATVTQPITYPDTVATLPAPAGTGIATNPSGYNGSWICYQVAGDWTPATWYSQNANANGTAVRQGLWVTAVAMTNSGGAPNNNKISSGDTITITYNQNVSASGTITVCAFTSGVVLFGDSGCGSDTDTPTLGKLTNVTIGSTRSYNNSAISKPAANQVRVTIGCTAGCTNSNYTAGATTAWVSTGTGITSSSAPTISPCTTGNCDFVVGTSSHF